VLHHQALLWTSRGLSSKIGFWLHEPGACLTLASPRCRGSSIYRGVRWHERNGKWEARIFDSASGKQARPSPPSPLPAFTLSGKPAATTCYTAANLASK
jgi:hypothetical protein